MIKNINIFLLCIIWNATNILAESLNSTKNITFKVQSIRDCSNGKDLFRIRRLFYPKIFNLPGSLEINGTFMINRQLPIDWNLSADISIKSRLGWISIPCDGCEIKNVCNEKMFNKCNRLADSNKLKRDKYCRCNIEKGLFEFPSLEIPIEISSSKYAAIKNYMNKKETEVKVDLVLKSAIDFKRFGCIRGIFMFI